jgi:flagellin-like protein
MIRRQIVKMNYQERKAVSPVIATVILVAVAITVSIGVSYWMGGIAGQYTDFEKVEVNSVVVTKNADGNWIVTASLKNSGSASATIDSIFVNDGAVTLGLTVPTATSALLTSGMPTSGLTLVSGQDGTIAIWIGDTYGELSSGTTVNLKFHSAGGMDYIKLVKLP